jgi:hypothetical protein
MYQQQSAAYAQRSAIPKVMGILMIVFASLGLLGTLRTLVGSSVPTEVYAMVPELATWRTIELLLGLIGLGVGFLHLLAGVRAVAYRDVAPNLAVAYATVSIITTLIGSTMVYVYLRPMLGELVGNEVASVAGPMMIATNLVMLAWPVIVLILMTRPSARAACVNVPAGPVRLGLNGSLLR